MQNWLDESTQSGKFPLETLPLSLAPTTRGSIPSDIKTCQTAFLSSTSILCIMSDEGGSREGASGARVVFADPYAELPFRSDKYAGNCVEMHLGDKGLTDLRDFNAFKSMSVLWINNNKLTSFAGLETNFRVKEVYAHDNKIQTLGEDCLSHMTFLNTLTLNGNKLDDMENVLEELRPMANLLNLDLYDNPLAQEDNYRLRVIGELETLQVLDRHSISEEEHEEARDFMKKLTKLANFTLTKKKVVVARFTPEEAEHRRSTCESIVARFNDKTFRYRIALERYFAPHDKRHLGRCSEAVFWDVLGETGLTPLLADDFEREVLVDKYRIKVDVPAASETGFMRKELMHYRRLCEDVLRPEIRREADETWRPNMAPAISVSTMDLSRYVKEVNTRTALLASTREREELEATRASSQGTGESVFGNHLAGKTNKCDEHGLNEFRAGELIKLISSFSGNKVDNKKELTIEQAETIMKKMAYFGVVPALGVKGAADALSAGGTKTSLTALQLKDALGASVVSSSDIVMIKWRTLTGAEKEKLATRMFGDAGSLLDSLLRLAPADAAGADGKELLMKTTLTGIHATRLRSDYKREEAVPTFVAPAETLSRAPNRADVVILPNLLPDVIKEAKQKEILSKADWSKHLAKLGLKGEFLSVAIERKNRSVLKQASLKAEKDELKKKIALGLVIPDVKGKLARKPLVPPSDGGPKGWAASTGNVVIG